jgi:hypothetical protein
MSLCTITRAKHPKWGRTPKKWRLSRKRQKQSRNIRKLDFFVSPVSLKEATAGRLHFFTPLFHLYVHMHYYTGNTAQVVADSKKVEFKSKKQKPEPKYPKILFFRKSRFTQTSDRWSFTFLHSTFSFICPYALLHGEHSPSGGGLQKSGG